ncbi:Uncharacterized protein HZ326_19149 [Fusarium oxysporum f. sp. albedinis]|nr:Uncharacterized protein HZ326_19149 [Fusarium oxysporum f. sp. albedinis]
MAVQYSAPGQRKKEPRLYCYALIIILYTAIKQCNRFLKIYRKKPIVWSILRVYLQEVLGMLNLRDTNYSPAKNYFKNAIAKEELLRSTNQASKIHQINKQQTAYKDCKHQNPQNEPQIIQHTGTLLGAPLAGDEDEMDDDRVDIKDY